MAARRSSFSSTRAAAWAIELANATSCEPSWGSPCTVRRNNTPAARPCTNTGSATADRTLTSIRCSVQRPRLEGVRHGVRPAVCDQDDDRRAPEARGGRQIAHPLCQARLLGGDREDQKVGRLLFRPIGAG